MLDEHMGEPIMDSNGSYLIREVMVPYLVNEIIALGFVEDWLFDEKTLSIQKKVKGLMPTVFEKQENYETGMYEVIGLKKIFCIKY
jgi:hypothetical protein